MNLVRGEIARLAATRLPLATVIAAVLCGGLLPGLLGLIGPEHSQPPMPGIDTAEGVGISIGLTGMLLFVPALIGTVAITGEFRHRTIGTTFLMVPRRGRVLIAKLAAYAALGVGYGVIAAIASGLALVLAASVRGVRLGVGAGELMSLLAQFALAAAAYMVLGVAIGAVARQQLPAVGIVLGYFYLAEPVLMLLPGLNVVYPYLPGGATAALTDFTFLIDTTAQQLPISGAGLLSPPLGGLLLLGYAGVACLVAVAVPLRRDLA